jgi:hypothetical protein
LGCSFGWDFLTDEGGAISNRIQLEDSPPDFERTHFRSCWKAALVRTSWFIFLRVGATMNKWPLVYIFAAKVFLEKKTV